jgi:hypothetical protein
MKMSNFIFTCILALFATALQAQSGRTSFGILGGVNFQNIYGKDFQGNDLDNDLVTGFHVGVNAQIPIASEFYFQPGLLFSTKGSKGTENAFTTTYRLSYIEMPLNLVYKGALGNGFVMVGFGPYIGYGIQGRVKQEGSGSSSLDSDVVFKNSVGNSDPLTTPYFRAFDVGGNVFAGYEWVNGIFMQLNSQLGMVEINPDDNRLPGNKTSLKNIGFGLSLGYRF